MAGKRFASSMFGFDKGAVNTYLENLTRDYEEKLTSKDVELEKMMNQLKKVNGKYEALKLEEERIYTEKEKISQALVSANEMADKIVTEAKGKVAAEVTELEAAAENEREKIVDIRKELKEMKTEAASVLSKYTNAVNSIITESSPESAEKTEAAPEAAKSDVPIVETAAADDEEGDDFFG